MCVCVCVEGCCYNKVSTCTASKVVMMNHCMVNTLVKVCVGGGGGGVTIASTCNASKLVRNQYMHGERICQRFVTGKHWEGGAGGQVYGKVGAAHKNSSKTYNINNKVC